MALKHITAIIVIYVKLISGASYSSVLVQSGDSVIPLDYLNYGSPLVSQISTAVDPVLSLPQVSAIVSPCVSPCVIANPPVPLAPATGNARLVTYNSPLTNVPVVVAKKDEARGYQYGYAIYDQGTGDKKTQSEVSDGSIVQGQYSFIQPDGVRREVSYTADDLKGFNAIVRNILVNNGDSNTDVASDDNKATPCDDKSAKITEQLDIDTPIDITEATDKITEPTTTESSNDIDVNNGIISYKDVINCLQSKLKGPNSVSPLTYIFLPSIQKLC